jgi:TIR domain
MQKNQIFISHTNEESDFAESLQVWIRDILDNYVELFVSSDNGVSIPLGSEWPKMVKESLEKTSIVIVLVSYRSIDRKWIYFEAGAGYVRDIPVIPICIGGITKEELPAPLSLLQAIELPNKINEKALLNKIIDVSNLALPRSFSKVIDMHRLKFPKRQILQERIEKVSNIEKIDFKTSLLESEVKLKLLDFLIDNGEEFTISEAGTKSKLKTLKRRKYILRIIDELQSYDYIEKSRNNNQTFYRLTNTGRRMLEEIKKTYAVRPGFRPEGDGSA